MAENGREDVRSAEELVRRAIVEPGQIEEIKRDPVAALQKLAEAVVRDVPPRPPLESDVYLYRIIVIALGSVILVAAFGVIALSLYGRTIPETLTALGSGAIGALGGLLAPSPMKK